MNDRVRAAEARDINAMVTLLGHLFAQEAEFTPDRNRQRSALVAILANPALGILLVLERAGRVVGMVNVLYSISTALGGRVAVLEDVIVDPAARGSGAGTALITAALARARADGCQRISLVTDIANEGAQRLYERLGFTRSTMVTMRQPL